LAGDSGDDFLFCESFETGRVAFGPVYPLGQFRRLSEFFNRFFGLGKNNLLRQYKRGIGGMFAYERLGKQGKVRRAFGGNNRFRFVRFRRI
jgi:hypothetical protein